MLLGFWSMHITPNPTCFKGRGSQTIGTQGKHNLPILTATELSSGWQVYLLQKLSWWEANNADMLPCRLEDKLDMLLCRLDDKLYMLLFRPDDKLDMLLRRLDDNADMLLQTRWQTTSGQVPPLEKGRLFWQGPWTSILTWEFMTLTTNILLYLC